MNIYERQKDFLSVIEKLDISSTLFKNAQSKYEALATFLGEHGIEANIYPQGSFALGTVTRPIKKDNSPSYDLDCICQVSGTRSEYTPSGLRDLIENTLRDNDTYDGKLVKWEECFTIEYANINGVSFSIDLVPAVSDSDDEKAALITKGLSPQIIDTSIVIPRQNSEKSYRWISNNPKGFKKWFDEINAPFLKYAPKYAERGIFESASVEELPNEVRRSALQRVIQILKYQRDTYYSKLKQSDGEEIKPISALITTMTARIASNYVKKDCTVFELLRYVLDRLEMCIHQTEMTFEQFALKYDNSPVLSYRNGKWVVPNPADPDDNLADKWNSNNKIPKTFFNWVTTIKKDIFEVMAQNDDNQFGVFMENSFADYDSNNPIIKKYRKARVATPINASTASKPYHCS